MEAPMHDEDHHHHHGLAETPSGVAAIDLVHAGKFGRLVVLHGTEITDIPLADAIAKTRTVGQDLLDVVTGLQPMKSGA